MAQTSDPLVLYAADGLTLRAHVQAGLNAVTERNLFWNLAAATQPGSGFDPDTTWLEVYAKPGLSIDYALHGDAAIFGRVSLVGSYSAGRDAFDNEDTGATTPEEAHLGVRGSIGSGVDYEVSVGARELVLGTGMLIASGGTSGFERGALKLGPRKAWERAAIATLRAASAQATAFRLDPNELPSTDGRNDLAGLDLRWDDPRGGFVGATLVRVLQSDSPYPQAAPGGVGAPTVLPGARERTDTLSVYAATSPFAGALTNWRFTVDLAQQRNDRVDLNAWAGRVTASHTFADAAWRPRLTVGYQTFSGDDPATAALERFDPLYYQGSPSAWATGTKSASTFINANVNATSVALQVQPTPRDTLTLRYGRIRANELNSPVQFGQATRVEIDGNVVAGVTHRHLADDLFLEYSRIVSRHVFLSAGVATSVAGTGITNITGSTSNWSGGYVNVVVDF